MNKADKIAKLGQDVMDMATSIEAIKGKRHAQGVLVMFNVWQLCQMVEDENAAGHIFAAIAATVECLVSDEDIDLLEDVKMLIVKLEEANMDINKS